MFSNIISSCRKCSNANEIFYIQVKNQYIHYVYMRIEYTLNSKLIKKQTPVFRPGNLQRLTFPSNASDILLRVLDVSYLPPVLIGVSFIPYAMTKCFNSTGQSVQTSALIEVPC